jgi:nucleoside-diphosphate-sugar epimerase
VLVTGAAGFIGGYTVRALVAGGHEVTAFVRPTVSGLELPGVELLRGDLRRLDDAVAGEIAAHDAVVHLAAVTAGTPRVRFDGTVIATEHLLDALAAARWRGRFVHVSTLAVYGFNQLPHGGLLDESTPLEPDLARRDDYAWTKTWQERVVRRFADTAEAEVVVVRPGSVYGPERRLQHRLGQLLGRRVLLMVGGLTPMPLVYVENAASLLVACAEHPRAAGEVFNAIDPEPLRQWRYLRHLRAAQPDLVAVPVPLTLYKLVGTAYDRVEQATEGEISAPGFFMRYVMTPSFGSFRYRTDKAQRVLGWTPPVPTAEALRRTFAPAAAA